MAADVRDITSDLEAPFAWNELFFSRTDPGGVILSGNSVFQRISGYSWEELIDKPHKVIRHPDTPRGVFWLLWDTIKRGEPIGAYVKNRTKDGRYYWVFAVVTPIDGGYLSVRLKPGSELFGAVRGEYQARVLSEGRSKADAADSAEALLARLKELGFRDYRAFMAQALSQEIAHRDARLGRRRDETIGLFSDIVVSARQLLEQTDVIAEIYLENVHIPLNFQVQAALLGVEGAAIGAISSNYNTISAELNTAIERFTASARQVYDAINSSLFLVGAARLQGEISDVFRAEASEDDEAVQQDLRLLDQQKGAYGRLAASSLASISKQTEAFRQDCADMSRLAAGLEVTRVMGKVETSRLNLGIEGLTGLMDELEAFQKTISAGLKVLDQRNQEIGHCARKLVGLSARAA